MTVLERTAIMETVLERTAIMETVLERTAIMETVLERTAIMETVLERTAIMETVQEQTALMETVQERTALTPETAPRQNSPSKRQLSGKGLSHNQDPHELDNVNHRPATADGGPTPYHRGTSHSQLPT